MEGNRRNGADIFILMAGLLGFILSGVIYVVVNDLLVTSHCVVEGTAVDTPAGPVRIEQLAVDAEVLTLGPSGRREVGRVVAKQAARAAGYLEIVLEGGAVLKVTRFHPVALIDGWKHAGELRAGDRLRTRSADRPIAVIHNREHEVVVYDLEVAPNSNFYAAGVLVHNKRMSNERNGSATLKTVTSAEADFHSNDRDGNGVADFWVGDVAGLYRIRDPRGGPIKLIEPSLVNADAEPRPGRGGTAYSPPEPFAPKAGNVFKALTFHEEKDGRRIAYDPGNGRNPSRFGFVAYPYTYPSSGRLTFIVDEKNSIYRKDLGGKVIDTFPFDPVAAGWAKMD